MKKLSVESIFCQMETFSLHQNGVNEAKILRVIFFSHYFSILCTVFTLRQLNIRTLNKSSTRLVDLSTEGLMLEKNFI